MKTADAPGDDDPFEISPSATEAVQSASRVDPEVIQSGRSGSVEESGPGDARGALTHLDASGRAQMVDVGGKEHTARTAVARGRVELDAHVRGLLFAGQLPKGEGLPVARIAGIQAAKETSRLIPLCHAIALSSVEVEFAPVGAAGVEIRATARCTGQTGVEMEALTAVSVAGLTIYDMCKAICRGASIEGVRLLHKSGGKTGVWDAQDDSAPTSGVNPAAAGSAAADEGQL